MLNSIITTLNTKIKIIIPEKYMYIYVITFGLILFYENYITENRLIRFCVILIIISIYKIFHKNIEIINKYLKYMNIKQTTLLKIYKYKNPIIGLIIEIELKLSNIMYNTTKNNIKDVYKKIIYNILYHFTGLNGLKIILYKFYKILNDGKHNTIYEIIFKRIYGMLLSVLIFTNIIQLVINILKMLSTNIILGIYILLVIMSYIMDTYNMSNIEYSRKDSNVIGEILKNKKITAKTINENFNSCLGLLFIKDKLNYENYLKYLMLRCNNANGIEYNKPSYNYCYEKLNIDFDTEYIFAQNAKLKKQEKNQDDIDLINYCEYNILIYKLSLYYIGDVEKVLEIKTNLITIEKEDIEWVGGKMFSYEYNCTEFIKIYYKKIENVKLDKFGDLIENKTFYEKMHNYLYDNEITNTNEYDRLKELNRVYYVCDREDYYTKVEESIGDAQKEQELLQKLEDGRKEWEQGNTKNYEAKYYDIFHEIDIIKKKINNKGKH